MNCNSNADCDKKTARNLREEVIDNNFKTDIKIPSKIFDRPQIFVNDGFATIHLCSEIGEILWQPASPWGY